MKDDCVFKVKDSFIFDMVVISVSVMLIILAAVYFSLCPESYEWKRCRDHHSKQVCVNLLQETGE